VDRGLIVVVNHIPLLAHVRPLFDVPRIPAQRMTQYLQLMGAHADGVALPPLNFYNPMGKPHVAAYIDALMALDIDHVAEHWLQDPAVTHLPLPRTFQHGFAVVDDVAGGWTERSAVEMTIRSTDTYGPAHGWLTTVLFVSDPVDLNVVHQRLKATVARAAWPLPRHRQATLAELLAHERTVCSFAGSCYTLDADDLAYTHAVLSDYRDATAYHVHVAALFGDRIARANGFPPMGLSNWAGIALAGALDQPLW
jgi:hypothetical protein